MGCHNARKVIQPDREICPGCGGPKHRDAAICRSCSVAERHTDHLCESCGTAVSSAGVRFCRSCYDARLPHSMPMGGTEGERYGAIVTLENADGERLVVHRAGRVRAAISEASDVARRFDDTFRVICVSTPNTVYADLQGARPIGSAPELAVVPAALLHPRLRR